ncbi:MAG: hypothetical protein LBC02_02790 [Planctomycetaceae bacterium]|nr:hypothetical protein [Planctomycetaceae bacterium]
MVGENRQCLCVRTEIGVLPTDFLSDFRPNTGASRLSPTRCFSETSPTQPCFAEIQLVGDLSAKGCLPQMFR